MEKDGQKRGVLSQVWRQTEIPTDNLRLIPRQHELQCNRLCLLKMWSRVETGRRKGDETGW